MAQVTMGDHVVQPDAVVADVRDDEDIVKPNKSESYHAEAESPWANNAVRGVLCFMAAVIITLLALTIWYSSYKDNDERSDPTIPCLGMNFGAMPPASRACSMQRTSVCLPPAGIPSAAATCNEAIANEMLSISSESTVDCANQAVDEVTGCKVYGAFPAECGCLSDIGTAAAPKAAKLSIAENACGCIENSTNLDSGFAITDGHYGCSAGPQNVNPYFNDVPWCYMKNDKACPGSFSANVPGLPAIRQCGVGGFADSDVVMAPCKATAPGSCQGPMTHKEFVETYIKAEVVAVLNEAETSAPFNGQSIAEYLWTTMTTAPKAQTKGANPNSSIANCNGPTCTGVFTMTWPESFVKGDPTPVSGDIRTQLLQGIGHGAAYAGELYNGRTWESIEGGEVRGVLPSCPAPSYFRNGWKKGPATPTWPLALETVPPTPCLCMEKCISQVVYGDGMQFVATRPDGAVVYLGKTTWWTFTQNSNIYFTTTSNTN